MLFIAERYLPAVTTERAHLDAARATEASHELAAQGMVVRYLGSVFVPSDETCFAVFDAASAEDVTCLLARASIPYQRVVGAVPVGTGGLQT